MIQLLINRWAWLRQVLIGSGFVAPMIGINPSHDSDAALATATTDYRLVRIRLTEARTGPDGPGDLAWIWPTATLLLLAALWRNRRAKN